jgi:replicative DNA helicase
MELSVDNKIVNQNIILVIFDICIRSLFPHRGTAEIIVAKHRNSLTWFARLTFLDASGGLSRRVNKIEIK